MRIGILITGLGFWAMAIGIAMGWPETFWLGSAALGTGAVILALDYAKDWE